MHTNTSFDDLYAGSYEQLRRLAATIGRNDPSATLNPTALVNEAYLRLAQSQQLSGLDADAVHRLAATTMRRILVDAARRRRAAKRGGKERDVTLLPEGPPDSLTPDAVLALDAAMHSLSRLDERQAQIVELRFFGGYSVDETARLLNISASTVAREWRMARAWLNRAVSLEMKP